MLRPTVPHRFLTSSKHSMSMIDWALVKILEYRAKIAWHNEKDVVRELLYLIRARHPFRSVMQLAKITV
ncbi:hypothetical protein NECAME_03949 [Necator americanus]|uniref:Uncharacterized protein n=1 Tax=Necator americanus TaxID=51031 RepID=W2T048_NECAM|nr:hypothetical protein NECAME_03949 [Necator americanus]ETN74636.1 hypothetical protein NECAME_03949 [Necator americanus]